MKSLWIIIILGVLLFALVAFFAKDTVNTLSNTTTVVNPETKERTEITTFEDLACTADLATDRNVIASLAIVCFLGKK